MATSQLPKGAGIIGAAVPRIDGPLKTTGTARYSLDHHFPNLAHAVAVQSTIGKADLPDLDLTLLDYPDLITQLACACATCRYALKTL
jgi:hypothetical protein